MSEWKTTSCVLCAQNCGLEVLVEDNRITKVRPDKHNPRSQGYVCRKGVHVAAYHHHGDRITHPLKRTSSGFERISWDQAVSEISERLQRIVGQHGPRAFAFMGGGGQGMHFEAAFGRTFMKALGSRYHYNALAQELTGYFWLCGRMFGRQNRFAIPDEHRAEMMLAIGWNGMVSHQMPRAPLVLKEFSKNPDKSLVVIDPRRSETARIANLHLALRPGSDALLARSMIAIIVQQGWEAKEYLRNHTRGFVTVRPWFQDFDARRAIQVCGLDYDQVFDLCRQLSRRKWCMHFDLGVYMGRHSTMASYLYMLLTAICGRFAVPGGNVIPGTVVPMGSHSDERRPKTWQTVETHIPAILGLFPPNVFPEEVLSEKPDRLRAVIVSGANPLRSFADTAAYERAFEKLELAVTLELSMTETAELSDYVLPICSAYESHDATFFAWTYPEIYFQIRQPVVQPEGERKETGEVFAMLARGMGMVPELPAWLRQAAKRDRFEYTAALFSYVMRNPKAAKVLPFIVSETLGRELGSSNLAAFWGALQVSKKKTLANASRAGLVPDLRVLLSSERILRTLAAAIRYQSPAPLALMLPRAVHAETIYDALLAHPEGMWIGKLELDQAMAELRTKDGKILLAIPEMAEWMNEITPAKEAALLEPDPKYPLVLSAGSHMPENANTLMRDPSWHAGRRACTLTMNPRDAQRLGLVDRERVRVETEAGDGEVELQITDDAREGHVAIPHGFGLKHNGVADGINVNRLTKNSHRDRLAGTPLHRFVPCRVEKIGA